MVEGETRGNRMETTAIVQARDNLRLDQSDNNVSAGACKHGMWGVREREE